MFCAALKRLFGSFISVSRLVSGLFCSVPPPLAPAQLGGCSLMLSQGLSMMYFFKGSYISCGCKFVN